MMTILLITKLTATILNCKRKRRLRASFDIREQDVGGTCYITHNDYFGRFMELSDQIRWICINITFVAQNFHSSAIQFLLVNTAHG